MFKLLFLKPFYFILYNAKLINSKKYYILPKIYKHLKLLFKTN